MTYLDKHLSREKILRRLEREMKRLHRVQGDAPIIPLERPYQRGWVKSFVLRHDVLRRPDAGAFRTALPIVNQRVYSRDRSFLRADGSPLGLHPRIIPAREWHNLAWPAKVQRLFSYGHWRLESDAHVPLRWRRHILGFKVVGEWWLEEDIQPRLITHQRVELPLVRERLAEIESFMQKTAGWAKLRNLRGQRACWLDDSTTASDLRAAVVIQESLSEWNQ